MDSRTESTEQSGTPPPTRNPVVVIIKSNALEKQDLIMNVLITAKMCPQICRIGKADSLVIDHERKMWQEHYAEHKGKDFYDRLVDEMAESPYAAYLVFLPDGLSYDDLTGVKRLARIIIKPGEKKSQNGLHISDSREAAIHEAKNMFNVDLS